MRMSPPLRWVLFLAAVVLLTASSAVAARQAARIDPPPTPWSDHAPPGILAPPSAHIIPATVTPSPIVTQILAEIQQTEVYTIDGGLSGEWPVIIGGQPVTLRTRYTNASSYIQKATQYAYEKFQAMGYDAAYHVWGPTTAPNVIATKPGLVAPDEIYLITAHLDDTSQTPTTWAPGADDNGSGSAAVLHIADVFRHYNFASTIRFVLFTGEEQGLLGSAAYAQMVHNRGENIRGVFNYDMIAYNSDTNWRVNLHVNNNPATVALADLFIDVDAAYNLGLVPIKVTNIGGGSDHQSFWQYGYAAILGIEDLQDFNPQYHTTGDRIQNNDFPYFTEFTKAAAATLAHAAGVLESGIGYLDGTVTAAGSGVPLPATVTARHYGSGATITRTASASGYYTMTLVSGTYSVTARYYGYLDTTVPDVQVVTGSLTTQNLSMPVAPVWTVSGTVTEAGTGAPLSATVRFLGTPLGPIYTDPATGFYSAEVAQGTWTMRVMAAGHAPVERVVNVNAHQTQNFVLERGSGRCGPPDPFGYRCEDLIARDWITATTPTGITQDDQVVTIPIGFTFNFYGAGYTTVNVSSNGNLQFTTSSTAWANVCPLPASQMGRMIAPFWDDLYPPGGGGVYTSVTGTAPNRILTIEWRDIRHYGPSPSGVTFEVQLEEATGDIYWLYRDTDFGDPGTNRGGSATTGIQNATGGMALQYTCNQDVLTDGLAVRFFRPTGATPTPTPTAPPTVTPTPTPNWQLYLPLILKEG